MTDTRQSWDEVASKLSGLGLKLKYHFEQEHAEEDDDDQSEAVRSKLDTLTDALDDAFDALSNATNDKAVKEDVVDAAKLLRDALGATFAEASASMRKAVAKLDE